MTGQYNPEAPISDRLRLLIAREEEERRQLASTQADIAEELRALADRRGLPFMRIEHVRQELAGIAAKEKAETR